MSSIPERIAGWCLLYITRTVTIQGSDLNIVHDRPGLVTM